MPPMLTGCYTNYHRVIHVAPLGGLLVIGGTTSGQPAYHETVITGEDEYGAQHHEYIDVRAQLYVMERTPSNSGYVINQWYHYRLEVPCRATSPSSVQCITSSSLIDMVDGSGLVLYQSESYDSTFVWYLPRALLYAMDTKRGIAMGVNRSQWLSVATFPRHASSSHSLVS